MSDFQKEIIMTLLDKGLLAIILLILAFHSNKILEKFKAKNIYLQKLAEYRIEIYQEIAAMTMDAKTVTNGFINDVLSYNENKLDIGQLKDSMDNMFKSHENLQKSISKSHAHISTELLNLLQKLVGISASTMNLSNKSVKESKQHELTNEAKKIYNELSIDIIQRIRLEINKGT